MPDRCPRCEIVKSAAQSEETTGSLAATRCAIATGAPALADSSSRPHRNNPAAARIERTPGARPTRPPRRRSAEESAWRTAARLKREETRRGKPLKIGATHV